MPTPNPYREEKKYMSLKISDLKIFIDGKEQEPKENGWYQIDGHWHQIHILSPSEGE